MILRLDNTAIDTIIGLEAGDKGVFILPAKVEIEGLKNDTVAIMRDNVRHSKSDSTECKVTLTFETKRAELIPTENPGENILIVDWPSVKPFVE